MRKVIKISGKLLSATILLLIMLPVTLSLLLDIPAVQNFVAHKAAEFASQRLETRVDIDRLNVSLPNRINVYGFYVEDYQRDTLLYVGHLRANLTGVSGGISFGSALAERVKLYIVESPDSVMNIKEVVDRIANPKKKKKNNFRLTIDNASIDSLDLHIERLEHRNPEYGVDYGNMQLLDMCGRVSNFGIAGTSISGDIESLRFHERSGFVADDIKGWFRVDRGLVELKDANIITAKSDITLDSFSITGGEWTMYKDFIHNVRIDADASHSRVSSDDVGYFAPALRRWETTLSDVDMRMNGTVADFTGDVRSARSQGGATLRADVSAVGLPDYRTTDFSIDIKRFASSAEELERLAANIARLKLPESVVGMLDRADDLSLKGRFAGKLSSFRTKGVVGTAAGDVGFEATMTPEAQGTEMKYLEAKVTSASVDLGRILGNTTFGTTGVKVKAEGEFGSGAYGFDVDGTIDRFTMLDYTYDSIKATGRVENGAVDASVTARDRNLDFDLRAVLGLGGELPSYDVVVDLHKADLSAMHINKRDSISTVSANIGVAAVGHIPDALDGEVSIANIKYRYNDQELTSEHISLVMDSNEDVSSFVLTSDFADAVFESRSNYKDVWAYLKAMLGQYLPLLDEVRATDAAVAAVERERKRRAHNFSLLSFTTKNFNPVADAFVRGLQIADGSTVQVLLDPISNLFLMRAYSDYIERDRMLAMMLNLNVSNRSDSLVMRLSAEDFYLGTFHFPDLAMRCGVKDNLVDLSAKFHDSVRNSSGDVGAAVRLKKDSVTNRRSIDISLAPSKIERGGNRWDLSARRIDADSSRILIDNFMVRNERQSLIVDGVASRSRKDSLTLELNDFDLSPLLQVAEKVGYNIEGRTNGYASVKSALKGSEIDADIQLDSILVNKIPLPAMKLDTQWDFERNRARFFVTERVKRDTLIRGFYAPSQVRYYAKADMDSLDMALIDPLLKGVVSNTHGVAVADLTFTGERRKAELRGDIAVRDLSTTVDFTQVEYRVPSAKIEVRNNLFHVDSVAVYDVERNEGSLTFDLSLNHLSNISYKLNVQPRKMLVLNTTAQDNDYFYGKVYASGAATIAGDKSGVVMDIVATTDDNTEFYLPLSGKSNVSNADFVTFEQADKPDTTNFLVRKKLMFERRQRKRATSAGAMDINMALDVRPNAMCQLVIDPTVGDIIKGRGEGALNLHINPTQNVFEMYGDYTISEGSYLFTLQNIINKKFIIEEGSTINWTGEPVDALLNINAVYKVKASLQPLLAGSVSSNTSTRAVPVDCIIHLSDRLTKPTVTFDVVVPNADPDVQAVVANALSTPESRSQQFLYLLVANSFISEAASDTSSNIGVSASAATGFELLSNQLSNWLSADDYNIVIRYRPKTDVTSDEVDFGFSTELINNRLLLEVEGNYLVDKSMAVNPNASNLMGEAYLTWLIDRAGNLRLKGFTHTIDRFDENQGLQETGIGIYYKQSFDNLKDLKQRVKENFMIRRREKRSKKSDAADKSGVVAPSADDRKGVVNASDGASDTQQNKREQS
ncbi:MAG: translocation/assembly module TamB domain-containing protein, partial [Alistipes sp.]|nr:translocation/assembly module TamB domain-containing protein [Alistipes sp.]